MASKNGMVSASSLGPKDIIEVPIEACEIVSMVRVPGQLKNRGNYLIQIKVVPISGPWANCEGTFVVESADLIPLVRKHTNKERRKAALKQLLKRLFEYIKPAKPEALPRLESKLTGDYT